MAICIDNSREHLTKRVNIFARRPNLSCSFSIKSPATSKKWDQEIGKKRFDDQEKLLVEELLYCMQGIACKNIRIKCQPLFQLTINPFIDVSIRELANRCLPVCGDYNTIVRYMESIMVSADCGPINQAFGSAIRDIMDEYDTYVTQLEKCKRSKDGLSLQKIWCHFQPIQHVMKAMASACHDVKERTIKGGALLSYLYSKKDDYSGDQKSRDMFVHLLQSTSKPFFLQLERWMNFGDLVDKKNEFMISRNVKEKHRVPSGRKFDHVFDWERRFAVNEAMCPKFLESKADKILNTGKYWNIIASCERRIDPPSGQKLQFTPNDRRYLRIIDDAYVEAGKALVKMLVEDYALINRFKSLKHYFLLDRGDWLVHFLEHAQKELSEVIANIPKDHVSNLLVLSLNLSSVGRDFMKDEIKCEFLPQTLIKFLLNIVRIHGVTRNPNPRRSEHLSPRILTGYESLTMVYDAKWPLSIVFNREVMFKYQFIFRQLLLFKNVEWQLSRAWLSQSGNVQQAILLHKLMTFVRKYLYHASVDAIEPYCHAFMDIITKRRAAADMFTLDDLLRVHSEFLDNCMKDLLLTEEPLILCVDQIVKLCSEVAKKVQQGETDLDTQMIEQEYAVTVEELVGHMKSLSNTKRGRGWIDVAHSLGLMAIERVA